MDGIEFEQLVKTFQNVETLPQLPESSIRLVQVCEDPDATLQDAERVITSDPGLAATVIRAASAARFFGIGGPATSVAAATMRLGIRALKALAMTYTFRILLDQRNKSEYYDAHEFARHSVFVAIATQYIYGRDHSHCHQDPEEVFAFGLFHDLGSCLLAYVAPEIYDRLWLKASADKSSFEEAFFMTFHEPLATVGWAAAAAWNLPEIFVEFLHAMTRRGEPTDLEAVCETIHLASDLSACHEYGMEPWVEGVNTTDLAPVELEELVKAVDDYCAQAFGIPRAA